MSFVAIAALALAAFMAGAVVGELVQGIREGLNCNHGLGAAG